MSRIASALLLAGVAGAGLALPSTALAQAPVPSSPSPSIVFVDREPRGGATFGLDIGAGQMGCSNSNGDDCDANGNTVNGSGGVAVHAGYMLLPNLALLGELWGMWHTNDRITVSQSILAPALRYWPAPTLWLEGGLGLAVAETRYDGDLVDITDQSDTVPAVIGALGLELVHTPHFGFDLELRAGTGLYADDVNVYNLSLGAGVSWF